MSALPQRLRAMADHTGLDAVAELLREAADTIERREAVIRILERDALAEREEWQGVVDAVIREMPRRGRGDNPNAPGHAHQVPGMWDDDNGPLSGTECAWCKAWNTARAAIRARGAALTEQPAEPVAWSVFDRRTKKHWYTNDSKYTAQHYANEYSHREPDGTPHNVVVPLYTAPQPAKTAEQEPVATVTVNEAMGANFHFTRPHTLLPGQVLYVYTAPQPKPAEQPISDVTEAVTKTIIEVEKLLCEKLGRQWSAAGISIASLVDELAARAAPEAPQPAKLTEHEMTKPASEEDMAVYRALADNYRRDASPQPAKREPLTDEEIKAFAMEAFDAKWDADDETLVNKYGHGVYLSRFIDFARAIERAHGIGEQE